MQDRIAEHVRAAPAPVAGGGEAMRAPRIAVIIPTYGNWSDCLECLQLLAAQDVRDFTVVLVDDGSDAPPPRTILDMPFVDYVRLPHAGFAKTCNAGARKAIQEGCTHLLLLNDDTVFGAGFIHRWIEKVLAHPQAIMAPIIYYADRPDQVWFSGGRRSITVPFMSPRRKPTGQTAVDILTGCALMVPSEAWRRVGGLEEAFVTYYEDYDFLLRARKAGVEAYLVTEKELEVRHKVARTAGREGPWSREYRLLASRLLFIRRQFTGVERAMCLGLACLHLLATCVLCLPAVPDVRRLRQAVAEGMGSIPDRGGVGGATPDG